MIPSVNTVAETVPGPMSRRPALVLVLGTWVALLVLFTAQSVLLGAASWEEAALFSLRLVLPWIVFAPAAVLLAFHLPLDGTHWRRNLLVHLLMAAAVAWTAQELSGPGGREGGLRGGRAGREAREARDSFTAQQPPPPGPDGRPGPPMPRRGPDRPRTGRALLDLLVYAVVVTASQAITWSHRARERERRALAAEAGLARARLASLQSQLNPHFLFNALNGLSTLIHTDPVAADALVGQLGDLLRASLDTAAVPEIPLRRELANLESYIAIERTRFGSRLGFETEIDPAALDGLVPTFLLQPLVENAVKHGVEPVRAGGTVRVSARRDGEILRIEIRDTGAGLRSDPATKGHGIGLANTRSRLVQLYPGLHRFELTGAPGVGCTVRIDLPFHPRPLPTPGGPPPSPDAP